jgi:hypothetical protein
MVDLFERLDSGRPPQSEEPVKQSRRHAGQKALIKDVLANGPAPATLVEERGAAHGLTRKQLSYARRQMRIVSFKDLHRRRLVRRCVAVRRAAYGLPIGADQL